MVYLIFLLRCSIWVSALSCTLAWMHDLSVFRYIPRHKWPQMSKKTVKGSQKDEGDVFKCFVKVLSKLSSSLLNIRFNIFDHQEPTINCNFLLINCLWINQLIKFWQIIITYHFFCRVTFESAKNKHFHDYFSILLQTISLTSLQTL